MKSAILSVFLLAAGALQSQTSLHTIQPDTLRLGHHSGGPMDSVDVGFTQHSSTLPGGGSGLSENTWTYDFLGLNSGGARFRKLPKWKDVRFSALPHLGFGYVFGTQGAQYVKADYQQAFGTKNLLNIDYNLHRSNGFLRNSVYTHHNVQLQFLRKAHFYSFALRGQYLSSDIGQSNGIIADEFIDDFGLNFIPVQKDDAQSRYRGMEVGVEHYFDVLMRDTVNAFGVYAENAIRVLNHRYWEFSDTLGQLYGLLQIDNDSTMDQDQLSEAINGAGIYFKRPDFFAKAGFKTTYWRYFNLGNELSRTELNFDGEVKFKWGPVQLYDQTNFNITGANQEWFTDARAVVAIQRFDLQGRVKLSSLLPEPFQRFYYGNHVFSFVSSTNWQRQTNLDVSATAGYTLGSAYFSAFAQFYSLKDNYFFDGTQWRNDLMGTLYSSAFGVKTDVHYRILQVALKASYNQGDFMPDWLVQSRIGLQGRLFKTRKLLGQLGVEVSLHSGYRLANYLPMLDLFMVHGEYGLSPQALNLHAYGGFEIDQFRFFFRVENIGYAWNDSRNRIAEDYPIPSMQIRIGITWDFFN